MTKIFLPTELGVKGEGSNAGIRDEHTPDVKEVKAGETPGQKEQPEFYKRIRDIDEHDLTLAEVRAGVENTRNQVPYDEAPKDGEADEARKRVLNRNPDEKTAGAKVASETKSSEKASEKK